MKDNREFVQRVNRRTQIKTSLARSASNLRRCVPLMKQFGRALFAKKAGARNG